MKPSQAASSGYPAAFRVKKKKYEKSDPGRDKGNIKNHPFQERNENHLCS